LSFCRIRSLSRTRWYLAPSLSDAPFSPFDSITNHFQGHEAAKKIGAEAYFECSAKDDHNTAWIVEAIVHQACDMHDERERKRRAEQSLGNRAKETLSKAFKFGFGKK